MLGTLLGMIVALLFFQAAAVSAAPVAVAVVGADGVTGPSWAVPGALVDPRARAGRAQMGISRRRRA